MTVATVRRVEWGDAPIPEAERALWTAWMRDYGIDPNDVLLRGGMAVDDATRTITYTRLHRDAEGRRHLARLCPTVGVAVVADEGEVLATTASDDACMAEVTVEAGRPIAAFPS